MIIVRSDDVNAAAHCGRGIHVCGAVGKGMYCAVYGLFTDEGVEALNPRVPASPPRGERRTLPPLWYV